MSSAKCIEFFSYLLSSSFFLFSILKDLDVVGISREEEKSVINPSVDISMEYPPLSLSSSTTANISSSLVSQNSPSIESCPNDNSNWHDDGLIKTCINQTSLHVPSINLHEIPPDEILHEVNMNDNGDEFFLFSPCNRTDDEPSDSINDDKYEQEFEQIQDSTQISNRTYTIENKNNDNEVTFFDEFHCSSTVDPFGFKPNNSSTMVTNLDDILIDDYDDDDDEKEQQHLKDSSNYLTNTNYRRPIQEDILYEVEHENSLSDHSQNTSSIVIAGDNVRSVFFFLFFFWRGILFFLLSCTP